MQAKHARNARICLCMIVKDEAHVVCEALASLLPYLKYWVICDTGSTDGTPGVIEGFFAKHGVPGKLLHHEWQDFGTNRTLALQAVRALYEEHQCHYAWMFDADDVLTGALPVDELVHPGERGGYQAKYDAVHVRIGQGFVYDRMSVFRCGPEMDWCYRGVLHEYPMCRGRDNLHVGWLSGDYNILSRRTGARSQQTNKYLQDALVLTKALDEGRDPDLAARYTFYAAQSYHDAGMLDHALMYYKKRTTMGSWEEEVYYAAYRVATIMKAQCPAVFSEADVERAFLQAYKEGPGRAEPLYELARFYRERDRFKDAYAFGRLGQTIPSPYKAAPATVHLFVNEEVYDYQLDDEVAVAAYWLGKKDVCKGLCERLLQRTDLSPEMRTRVQQNLAFCE